jgi:hypothetical protein
MDGGKTRHLARYSRLSNPKIPRISQGAWLSSMARIYDDRLQTRYTHREAASLYLGMAELVGAWG